MTTTVTAEKAAATAPARVAIDRLPTPIGTALVLTDEEGCVRAFDWDDHEARVQRLLRSHYGDAITAHAGRAPAAVRERIEAYFDGARADLDGIACETGGSAFQRRVWAALRRIPVGETTHYGALATAIGSPGAARAVGLANGANPIGVIVPCHRVIGADGSLTGYGGGLDRKRWLLAHEHRWFAARR
ncbi:MAG: methylated-DNA--[protein]-cysteine S-methyltransferase [Dehalococcoidia bacterium]|nr:methylated-DNA--[protein]-cysteine S-methyltransferase [Dehalococcoidia bacterium]